MTIVHIVQRLAPGGIEQLALTHLAKGRGVVRVFSLEGDVDSLAAAWPAIGLFRRSVTAFAKEPGIRPGLVVRIALALRAVAAKGVVTHHVGPMIYGGLAARLAGIRALVHVEHDAWHLDQPGRRRLVGVAAFALRPRLAAVSQSVAASTSASLGRRVAVLANGVDTERFRPADRVEARRLAGLPERGLLVGAAGRLEAVKGFDVLIDAAARLPAGVRVVIFGDGSQRAALEERAAALGLSHRIVFAGRRDRMEEVFPALDLFCLPSRAEGLPLALLEAQACGVPAVACNVGGVAEALSPGIGELVEPGSPGALADAIGRLLSAPASVSPRSHVEQQFSLATMFAGYERLLKGADHA